MVTDSAGPKIAGTKLVLLCSSLGAGTQEQLAAEVIRRGGHTKVLMIRPSVLTFAQFGPGKFACGTDPDQIVSSCKRLLSQNSSTN